MVDDWKRYHVETNEIYAGLLVLMRGGVPAHADETALLVNEHRAQITKWFYDCTVEIHAGLGEMYVHDERFRQSINKVGDGLAEYLSPAIAARYAGK